MYEFKTKPYAHQREALRAATGREYFGYFMEMGTGKTKVAIDEIGLLYCDGKIDHAVILAPKGVYGNWIRTEIPTHLGVEAEVCQWVSGAGARKREELNRLLSPSRKLRILVMNTEALSSGTKASSYLEKFLQSGEGYMAVDESTYIKNHSSNRSKRVIKLGRLAKYRRIMTGSPVTRSPLDLFAQTDFLKSSLLGYRSFYSYRARYAVMQRKNFGGRNVDVVVGYRNTDELKDAMAEHSFRVTKKECLDLPEKVYTSREVQMTQEQKKLYDSIKTDAFAELETGFVSSTNVLTSMLRLQQVLCGHVLDEEGTLHEVNSNRVDSLMETVAEVEGDVIIWARFRYDVASIAAALRSEYGENSVAEYHGGNTRTREDDAERFKTDPECRFMISNQQSGGYGNTWVNASTVIYYSNDFDLEKRIQSEDRSHRVGQKQTVLYVDLFTPNTVDAKILDALRRKINIADSIMGDGFRDWIV